MDLSQYVERLRADLTDAAAAGDENIRSAAERLVLALDPSSRMVLLEALSDATAEITSELESATVEVRLRGREPEFVVTDLGPVDPPGPPPPPGPHGPPGPPPPPPPPEEGPDGDVVARVTVRIPEWLKTRAEQRASERSQSLNTWIVNAIKSASGDRSVSIDVDLGSRRIDIDTRSRRGQARRVQGWAR